MNDHESAFDQKDELAAGLIAAVYGFACALFGVAAYKLWLWIF